VEKNKNKENIRKKIEINNEENDEDPDWEIYIWVFVGLYYF
jgi:hypothetical protein